MRRFIVSVAVVGLAACSTARQAPILVETAGQTGVVMPIDDTSLDASSALAVDDLARRLSIPVTEIRLTSATEVDWRSSAIGCPQPDRMYMTVLTPGYRIVLEARGVQYHYHAARQGAPFMCPDERREPAAGATSFAPPGAGSRVVRVRNWAIANAGSSAPNGWVALSA